jgi:hypothetical protein
MIVTAEFCFGCAVMLLSESEVPPQTDVRLNFSILHHLLELRWVFGLCGWAWEPWLSEWTLGQMNIWQNEHLGGRWQWGSVFEHPSKWTPWVTGDMQSTFSRNSTVWPPLYYSEKRASSGSQILPGLCSTSMISLCILSQSTVLQSWSSKLRTGFQSNIFNLVLHSDVRSSQYDWFPKHSEHCEEAPPHHVSSGHLFPPLLSTQK